MVVRIAVAVFVVFSAIIVGTFVFYYVRYARIVDRRMSGPVFNNAASIFAQPEPIRVGEKIDVEQIAADLRRAGYSEAGSKNQSRVGVFWLEGDGIKIQPGPESYNPNAPAEIHFSKDKVEAITGPQNASLDSYNLEPELVTALFDAEQRAKRQVIKYQDIPKTMVDAVLAIEDRRFFQHSGVNYYRLMEAAWIDVIQRKHEQGGSTLTMEIARGFFLTPQKTIRRKLTEMLIAVELEQRFSKQQIFELYANQVYMGQRGSFTINGFAEAARAYFNKDLQSITLPEAALLAGLIQRPNYLSPYRNPERALDRRNLVLDSMVETGAITRADAERAKATPLKLAPFNVEASDAPYFVDLVKDTLVSKFSEQDLNDRAYRIYTTLDTDLQRAAAQAVDEEIKVVDAKITKLRTRKTKVGKGKAAKWETKVLPGPQAQVALIAMDPHSGQVLALVGGRNYGMSQLDHAVSKRPTGSIFKPFVYAAAVNTALQAPEGALTPASLVDDSPSTFAYGDQIYEPRNYKDEYHGQVTARYALAESLNNATVKVAELVGYDKVADLARSAGITSVKPTPAMALGAYDATPLDMASAYTVFANDGVKLSPVLITQVRNAKGEIMANYQAENKPVLDPRVASVMTNMMEGVLNFGTAYGVRASGFNAPAAGKTGSSHDGWFAGYTSNLLCIVWVGYDDYSDIRLSGADTAAPIWGAFMKRAVQLPQYRDVKPFPQPSGVVTVQLDKGTNALATPTCPDDYSAEFIEGTEPKQTCDQAVNDNRGILSKILGIGNDKALPPNPAPGQPGTVAQKPGAPGTQATVAAGQPQPAAQEDPNKKKKGLFGKIVGIFKDDKQTDPPSNQPR